MRSQVLFFVGEDYEDLELWYPLLRLQEAGAGTVVAGMREGHTYEGKHGYPCRAEAAIEGIDAGAFDAVVIPGGWMPDRLRREEKVLSLVRAFHEAGKPIASICHGPHINISAGIVRGVQMTGSKAVKDDLVNAGAIWRDEAVVVDRHHISSRSPADLPQFAGKIVEMLGARR